MKPMYRTLDLYTHRKFKDISGLIAILWIRVVLRIAAVVVTIMLLDSDSGFINGFIAEEFSLLILNFVLDSVVLILAYIRKPIILKWLRGLTIGVFVYNVLFILFIHYDPDSWRTLLFSGMVALYFMLSAHLHYYYTCAVRGGGEYGLCYGFGGNTYYPKYNIMIIYHDIETEVLTHVTLSHVGSIKHRISNMRQANNLFNAYLAVVCASGKKADIAESVFLLREKLMSICRWNRSVISMNEDSFVNCTYVLRKAYEKSGNIRASVNALSRSLCASGLNMNSEELTVDLLKFYQRIESPDYYENYYNYQLMPNAALFMN